MYNYNSMVEVWSRVPHYSTTCQQAWTYFYKFGKVCTVATRKYCKPKYLLACFQNFKINNSQNIIPFNKKPNSYSPRGFELAGLYCIYVFGMPMKDRQQRLWWVKQWQSLIQKLCGERIQIKEIHVLLPFVWITLISECSPTCIHSSYIFLSGQ